MWVCQHGLDFSSISLNNVPFLVAHSRDFQLGKHRPQRQHSCELKPAVAFPQCCQLSCCQKCRDMWRSLKSPAPGGQGFFLRHSASYFKTSTPRSHGAAMVQVMPAHKKIEFSLSWLLTWMRRFCNTHLSPAVILGKRRLNTPRRTALHPGGSSAKIRDWQSRKVPAGNRLLDIEMSRRAKDAHSNSALIPGGLNGPPEILLEGLL